MELVSSNHKDRWETA